MKKEIMKELLDLNEDLIGINKKLSNGIEEYNKILGDMIKLIRLLNFGWGIMMLIALIVIVLVSY